MTNAIYLATTEPHSGKSVIALGLVNLLAAKTEKIAYFKPVINSKGNDKDRHLDAIASYFNLSAPYRDMYVFTRNEVMRLINSGHEAQFIDTIIDRFKKLQEQNDFVVVEGTDFMGSITNFEFDGNISIAKNLGIPA